jgi:hypothetical protein
MLLTELFQSLSFGHLSNLSIGKNGSGDIAEEGKGKVIRYTNQALLRLYSRFVLSEKQVIIELMEGITTYYLLKRFAQFRCDDTPTTDPLYIADLLDPFQEDVIKVLQAFNSLGKEMSLNDESDRWSLFTPAPNQVQVPIILNCASISLSYQAKHPKLKFGVESQQIILPETLHDALEHYVAYGIYSAMNGQENTAKAEEHLGIYESICKEVESMDLVNQSKSNTTIAFHERGWI